MIYVAARDLMLSEVFFNVRTQRQSEMYIKTIVILMLGNIANRSSCRCLAANVVTSLGHCNKFASKALCSNINATAVVYNFYNVISRGTVIA